MVMIGRDLSNSCRYKISNDINIQSSILNFLMNFNTLAAVTYKAAVNNASESGASLFRRKEFYGQIRSYVHQ